MPENQQVRRLGDLEAAIMELVWDATGPLRVREVVDQLQPERTLAYTTVMTVMDNLHTKGWLTRERDGRAWSYRAAGTRQTYAAQLMNDVLTNSTDRAGALAQFAEQIDPADAETLAQALADALSQRRDGSAP